MYLIWIVSGGYCLGIFYFQISKYLIFIYLTGKCQPWELKVSAV